MLTVVVAAASATSPPPMVTITMLVTKVQATKSALERPSRSKRWWPMRAPPKVSPGIDTARPSTRRNTTRTTWSWRCGATCMTIGKAKAMPVPTPSARSPSGARAKNVVLTVRTACSGRCTASSATSFDVAPPKPSSNSSR